MDERIASKEKELREIISDKIDEIYEEAHQLITTTSGDITPQQAVKLQVTKQSLYKQVTEQLEQNLPEIPLNMDFVKSKIKTVTAHKIDASDFDEIVQKAYGESYEIIAEEEMNNGQVYTVDVPSKYRLKDDECKANIRKGEYPPYSTGYIADCLYEDGYLPEGVYEIIASW